MPTDCTPYFNEKRDHKLNFFLIAAICGANDKGVQIDRADKYNVSLTINGVEVDVEHAVGRFFEQFDRQVAEAALKLALEKTSDICEVSFQITDHMRRLATEKLGLPPQED